MNRQLPLTARIRLAIARRIDTVGARLVEHGHIRGAERLWRACRTL